MQSSFLSRNVLYISGPFVERQLWVMTNDGSISPVLDLLQQRLGVPLDVGLARLERQPLVHRGAHRDLVGEPDVDARDRDACRPCGST